MHPAIPHLIELQRVDHQMAVLRAELESFPKRLREADTKLSGARAEIASAKDALAKITTERKKFECRGGNRQSRRPPARGHDESGGGGAAPQARGIPAERNGRKPRGREKNHRSASRRDQKTAGSFDRRA